MLPHMARFVCDDKRLVLGLFRTLGECAQAPFSCILALGGFCFSLDSMMSSFALIEYNQVVTSMSGLINL